MPLGLFALAAPETAREGRRTRCQKLEPQPATPEQNPLGTFGTSPRQTVAAFSHLPVSEPPRAHGRRPRPHDGRGTVTCSQKAPGRCRRARGRATPASPAAPPLREESYWEGLRSCVRVKLRVTERASVQWNCGREGPERETMP